MKALITANYDEANLDRLRTELGMEIDYRPIAERPERLSESALIEALDGVEVFIVGYEGITEQVLDEAEDLRLIACARGGPDANVDIASATKFDIPVLYAPGRNAVSVADFTLGLILDVARNISYSHHQLHTGTYTGKPLTNAVTGGEREDVTWGIANESPYDELKGPELEGKTVGIIGLGAIGQEVATRAAGFDVSLVGFDPYVDAAEMAKYRVDKVDLATLCRKSDFVTVHVPVMDSTRGLIGEQEFELMSDDAFFINTARAAISDQEALVDALENDELGGAALDVYAEEPLPDDHPLLSFPNVVTTPHIAGAAREVVTRHATMLTDDIAAIEAGESPEHIANRDGLATIAGGDD